MTERRKYGDMINDRIVTPPALLTDATGYVVFRTRELRRKSAMDIRFGIVGAAFMTASIAVTAQVVDLPAIRASAESGCVEPAPGASSALSYGCLTRLMTAPPSTPAATLQADPSQRPSNTLGLYNASGLRNRMGPTLGISVQPYRPKVSYPNPLVH